MRKKETIWNQILLSLYPLTMFLIHPLIQGAGLLTCILTQVASYYDLSNSDY